MFIIRYSTYEKALQENLQGLQQILLRTYYPCRPNASTNFK